jgi:hypothetical protein
LSRSFEATPSLFKSINIIHNIDAFVNNVYIRSVNIAIMNNIIKKMPIDCPSCGERLSISKMNCHACGTEVSGDYDIPHLMRLAPHEIEFAEAFIVAGGSLKEMARLMGASYPKVRNLLDEIIDKLKCMEDRQ